MTREELMVIAAAAAVFIIINIIMWTIIAKSEKKQKAKEKIASAAEKASETKAFPAAQNPSAATANIKKPVKILKEPRSDFVLIDDIVITHTDEFI